MKATETLCSVCGGTGWKEVGPDPKARQVARCDCALGNRTERLLRRACIPPVYQRCELSNFETEFGDKHDQDLSLARLSAGIFVEEYPASSAGLMLLGPSETGKTHLAVGVLKELILSKGIGCLFCDYRELIRSIQQSYNPAIDVTEIDLLRPVFDTEIVVLDDLGSVKPTLWVLDTVAYIINHRYSYKRTTIVTTNLPDEPAPNSSEEEPVDRFKGRDRQAEAARRARRDRTLGENIGDQMRLRLHEMCKTVDLGQIPYKVSVMDTVTNQVREMTRKRLADADKREPGRFSLGEQAG